MIATSQKAKEIFVELVACPPEQCDERLEAACGGDESLRRRVRALLSAHREQDSFLLRPADPGVATIDQPSTERIGTQIGPYKLLEQIGEGGMGVVYVAEQTQPVRRRVALKIIKPGMDSKQVIARFEAERQALAMMDHPNIAKILDAGTTGQQGAWDSGFGTKGGDLEGLPSTPSPEPRVPTAGRPFFVMELVRGMPITDYCDKARLEPRKRLQLFVNVCHAVQHAHQKGIIHRDLKPSNVMVTLHDGTPVVKVIDFGVAKAMGQSLTERTIYTAHAQLIGTPLYMSPEQAELSGLDVDTRSDVYSLGVLLYELLTGHTPFDKDTLSKAGFDEMRRIIREDEPPRPSHRVSTLNAHAASTVSQHRSLDDRQLSRVLRGELDWIVMKCLEKDRSRRYESASALAADIQRYLNGDLVQACPPSALYRFRKFAKKHRAAFTTATLLTASLLLGTTLSLWQAVRATAAEAQAMANETKAKTEGEKAKVEKQKALDAAASERSAKEAETAQRKLAEKNFVTALTAVDRMLEHVSDRELNELPRVGPLRRKMLKDAIAFYERLPVNSGLSTEARFSVAQTWDRIAGLSAELDEVAQARHACKMAIETLTPLVAAYQNTNYQATLAGFYRNAGWHEYHQAHDAPAAERNFRESANLFAGVALKNPQQRSWLLRESESLMGLSIALLGQGKRDDAIATATRSLELLDRSEEAHGGHRAPVLQQLAYLKSKIAPEEADQLQRRTIEEYRKYVTREGTVPLHERGQFASMLMGAAERLAARHPAEADSLWDESIAAWRVINAPVPSLRGYANQHVSACRMQSRHLRRLAAKEAISGNREGALAHLVKAEALFQEALNSQRQLAIRFALPEDRHNLIETIVEQFDYLLGRGVNAAIPTPERDDLESRKLQADALLVEAIQLCRALAAGFPDDANCKTRLAALLKLQAQHFGSPE